MHQHCAAAVCSRPARLHQIFEIVGDQQQYLAELRGHEGPVWQVSLLAGRPMEAAMSSCVHMPREHCTIASRSPSAALHLQRVLASCAPPDPRSHLATCKAHHRSRNAQEQAVMPLHSAASAKPCICHLLHLLMPSTKSCCHTPCQLCVVPIHSLHPVSSGAYALVPPAGLLGAPQVWVAAGLLLI